MNDQKTYQDIVSILRTFFTKEEDVQEWLNSPSNQFGGVSPMKLIEAGRGHKVKLFVERILQGDGV